MCASAAHDRSWRASEGLRVGNAAAVSREALIARLEQTASSGVNMNSCASGLVSQ